MAAVADDGSSHAGILPERPTLQARLLSPTPPSFEPEYDYLATLKDASQAAGLSKAADLLSSLLNDIGNDWDLDSWDGKPPRACFIDSSGSTSLFREPKRREVGLDDRVKWMHQEIKHIRQDLSVELHRSARDKSPHVVVIETNKVMALQVLGAAVGLDPEFLLRHLDAGSDENTEDGSLPDLKGHFFERITSWRHEGKDKGDKNLTSMVRSMTAGVESEEVRLEGFQSNHPEPVWPVEMKLSMKKDVASRISCSRIPENGCKSCPFHR